MKDETCAMFIKSIVGLKSKRYTYVTEDKYECKKAKSIHNSVVEYELKYKK